MGRSRGIITRLCRDKAALVALAYLTVLVVIAILAPVLAPYDPLHTDFDHVREPPNSQHWLGTDKQGRDILSRLMFGARISLAVGFLSQVPVLLIGASVGICAGYYGRHTDAILMRIVDVFYAFPAMLFLITLMSVIGRSFGNILLALGLTAWTGVARLVRGQVLQIKQEGFVIAAQSIGASDRDILLRHIMQHLTGPLLVAVSMGIPGAMLAEAGLSFLGLGLLPPAPSWGLMLSDGFAALRSAPHIALYPGLAIGVTMLALFMLGDAVRDAVDPLTAG